MADNCTTYFNLSASDIPADYRLFFTKLAQEAGDKNAVDSCDLQKVCSGGQYEYRYTPPAKSTFEIADSIPDFMVTPSIDYNKFLKHTLPFMDNVPTIGFYKQHSSDPFQILQKTNTALYEFTSSIPSSLSNATWFKSLFSQLARAQYLNGGNGYVFAYDDSSEFFAAAAGYSGIFSPLTNSYQLIVDQDLKVVYFVHNDSAGMSSVDLYDFQGRKIGYYKIDRTSYFLTNSNSLGAQNYLWTAVMQGQVPAIPQQSFSSATETDLDEAQVEKYRLR